MTLKLTENIYLFAILILLSLVFFLQTGCGKKMWPEPDSEADRFAWEEVKGTRDNGCLRITGQIKGAYHNLAKLELELETTSKDQLCPSCPFKPDSQVSFPVSSSQVTHKGPEIELVYCGLNPKMQYRWRLQGVNIFMDFARVPSKVHLAGN